MVLLADVATARTLVEVCPEVEAVATDCLRAACAKGHGQHRFQMSDERAVSPTLDGKEIFGP